MQPVHPSSALRDLRAVHIPHGLGIQGSANSQLSAIFPRDAVTAAWDLMNVSESLGRRSRGDREDPLRRIVEEVIVTAASLQGVRYAAAGPECNEEEPGKICHEHRSIFTNYLDGAQVSGRRLSIFHELSRRWGGDGTTVTAFNSIDSTPEWVRLVARYCWVYGTGILRREVTDRAGERVPVRVSLQRALAWLERSLRASNLGLLEFHSRHPEVLTKFQSWADGASFIHDRKPGFEHGELANWDAPIAALEVQGVAYDALVGASEILGEDEPWRDMAEHLRRQTLDLFWMPGAAYFAMGIDRDPYDLGRLRLITPRTSRAGSLLNSRMFDVVSGDVRENARVREQYLAPVVDRLCDSRHFLTPVGIRCRSLEHGDLVEHVEYQGHLVSWPKDTWDTAQGLRRQGFPIMAEQLENRIVAGVSASGRSVEFHFVLAENRVLYSTPTAPPAAGVPVVRVLAECVPEMEQAWTITAVLAAKAARGSEMQRHGEHGGAWAAALDAAIARREPSVPAMAWKSEIAAYREATGAAGWIDVHQGHGIDIAMRRAHDARLREIHPGLCAPRRATAPIPGTLPPAMTTPEPGHRLSRDEALRLARQRLMIDEVMDPKFCRVAENDGPDTWTVHFEQPWSGGRICDVILSKDEFEIIAVTYAH